MKVRYNVLTYLIGEGFSNVFKNKKQAMTSIGMMCVTMLIFGVFFVIGENLNHFVDQVQAEQGIQVFMKLDATDEQITTLKQELHANKWKRCKDHDPNRMEFCSARRRW